MIILTLRRLVAFFVLLSGTALPLAAQNVWVQIEAHPSAEAAEAAARGFAVQLEDVQVFRTPGGWFAIALGPQGEDEALARAARLRALGSVPPDSFVTDGRLYVEQIWAASGAAPAESDAARATEVAPAPSTTAPSQPARARFDDLPEESPAEAQRLERTFSAEDRRDIQTALAWTGDYTLAIDGAFGPGTRRAVTAWQERMGMAGTGFLTTRQKAMLLGGYADDLAKLGMRALRHDAAGIEMQAPLGLVAEARIEPPFVHFDARGDSGVRMLLISQEGSAVTLHGLFDIMQTLEIVPMAGFREKQANSFVLTGQNARFSSYTYAEHAGGLIKGFTLAWPRSDDRLMEKAVAMMRDSFAPFGPNVLDAAIGDGARQSLDLLSGLDIRRPERAGSGFFIDARGTVLTSSSLVAGCTRLTLDTDVEAELAFADEELGIAVLRPRQALAPVRVAAFSPDAPRLREEIAVSGYSYAGLLGAPTLTFGTLADIRGLQGEERLKRLSVPSLPGDVGGPVLDPRGAVLGLLLPRPSGAQVLPEDVHFALQASTIRERLAAAGLDLAVENGGARLAVEDLTTRAGDMTVLVSCWN